jgi:hypothetical protein
MIIKNTIGKLLDIAWPREDGTYNLRGADLSGITLIDAGQDRRGYRFVARQGDPMMIAAGCRWLTIADAREHWANNLECLGKVEMIVAEATRRGWTT